MQILKKMKNIFYISKKIFRFILIKILLIRIKKSIVINLIKDEIYKILLQKNGPIVAHGPFKGMRLNLKSGWSKYSFITQNLGSYEEHITKKLIDLSNNSSRFINIGASDGYFVIGLSYIKVFSDVIAFEINKDLRMQMHENSIKNNLNNQIKIYKEANFEIISKILSDNKKSTILIDIEGAEYNLLDEKMLNLMKRHYLICEMHPWMIKDGLELEKKLIKIASQNFYVDYIERNNYNPNKFKELDDLTDEQRLIALGEGRAKNMKWIFLSPKID